MLACENEKIERLYFEEFFNQLKASQTISKTSCVIASPIIQIRRECLHLGISFIFFEYSLILLISDKVFSCTQGIIISFKVNKPFEVLTLIIATEFDFKH